MKQYFPTANEWDSSLTVARDCYYKHYFQCKQCKLTLANDCETGLNLKAAYQQLLKKVKDNA